MIQYAKSLNPADCCGCRACEQICNQNAISMIEDEEGFLYPNLDESICVNCGLCEKVCPMSHANSMLFPEVKPLAVQNKDKQDLATSSSGGVFVAVAKQTIRDNGVVYGAAFDNHCPTLYHQRVESVEELEKLKGSKYLQSDIRNTYILVKQDLNKGRKVYFVGTPCQVAGLRLFLRKEYTNLLTSDFVCHGTPSNKIFHNTINQMENKIRGKFKNYSFRDKKVKGWSCCSSSSWIKGKKEIYLIYSKDMEAYFNAFISGDLMRMNCYECPFARHERCSDITLADNWGVRVFDPDFPSISKGVSMILLNTKKGNDMFCEIKSLFHIKEISISHTVRNKNFHVPSDLTTNRSESYELAFNHYESFVNRYYKGNYYLNSIKIHIEYFIRNSRFLFSLVSSLKRMMK